MAVLNIGIPNEIAKRLDNLSTKTEKPKEFFVKGILEEHLPEYENRFLSLEGLDYTKEAERILELYNQVPLYNQVL
jgi:predicted DNA-binding protein